MKKKTYIIVTIFILLSLILGLYWLSIAITCLFLLLIGKQILVGLITFNLIKKLVNVLFSFALIVCIAIGIRVFVADIYLIPSSSMENTLYPKDVILVNKLKYGPKTPQSPYEIPWVNIFYYVKDNSKKAIEAKKWTEKRLSGTSEIEQGDVIVFKNRQVMVKRCVAVAGDTFKIVNGTVFTNGEKYKTALHIRKTYQFKLTNTSQFYHQLDTLQLEVYVNSSRELGDNWKQATLSVQEAEKIKSLKEVSAFKLKTTNKPIQAKKFPWYKEKKWTLDNFGAIILPTRGMKIKLTEESFQLYSSTLRDYEQVKLKEKKGKFYLNNKQVTTYVFKHDYYFMMGDNRHDSYDSRYLGMIPKELMIGKVSCVLFSNKDDVFQWSRLFKAV